MLKFQILVKIDKKLHLAKEITGKWVYPSTKGSCLKLNSSTLWGFQRINLKKRLRIIVPNASEKVVLINSTGWLSM